MVVLTVNNIPKHIEKIKELQSMLDSYESPRKVACEYLKYQGWKSLDGGLLYPLLRMVFSLELKLCAVLSKDTQ